MAPEKRPPMDLTEVSQEETSEKKPGARPMKLGGGSNGGSGGKKNNAIIMTVMTVIISVALAVFLVTKLVPSSGNFNSLQASVKDLKAGVDTLSANLASQGTRLDNVMNSMGTYAKSSYVDTSVSGFKSQIDSVKSSTDSTVNGVKSYVDSSVNALKATEDNAIAGLRTSMDNTAKALDTLKASVTALDTKVSNMPVSTVKDSDITALKASIASLTTSFGDLSKQITGFDTKITTLTNADATNAKAITDGNNAIVTRLSTLEQVVASMRTTTTTTTSTTATTTTTPVNVPNVTASTIGGIPLTCNGITAGTPTSLVFKIKVSNPTAKAVSNVNVLLTVVANRALPTFATGFPYIDGWTLVASNTTTMVFMQTVANIPAGSSVTTYPALDLQATVASTLVYTFTLDSEVDSYTIVP